MGTNILGQNLILVRPSVLNRLKADGKFSPVTVLWSTWCIWCRHCTVRNVFGCKVLHCQLLPFKSMCMRSLKALECMFYCGFLSCNTNKQSVWSCSLCYLKKKKKPAPSNSGPFLPLVPRLVPACKADSAGLISGMLQLQLESCISDSALDNEAQKYSQGQKFAITNNFMQFFPVN